MRADPERAPSARANSCSSTHRNTAISSVVLPATAAQASPVSSWPTTNSPISSRNVQCTITSIPNQRPRCKPDFIAMYPSLRHVFDVLITIFNPELCAGHRAVPATELWPVTELFEGLPTPYPARSIGLSLGRPAVGEVGRPAAPSSHETCD